MSLRFLADVVAMLACSVYCTIPLFWLVVHPFVATWRKRGRRAFWLILPIWTACITAAFVAVWPYRSARFYESWWAWAPAALLFCVGLSVYRMAFRGFHRSQVSGLDELEPDRHRQELVTSGIRGRVRHPIYLAHLCEVAAWCVGTGLVALYALLGLAVVMGVVMIRIEDHELEARFGAVYREYRARVPGVVPRLR